MECDKCKSKDVKLIDIREGCEFDTYNDEFFEITVFTIKCNCCGFEFEEVM